jgi:hypothetical protein
MATINQVSRYDLALRQQEAEHERAREERQSLWMFLWVLFGFKVVSVGVLIWWIEWDEFVYLVGLTTWPWIAIPGLAISGPILNRLRLRRVRRKREALRQAEFSTEPSR